MVKYSFQCKDKRLLDRTGGKVREAETRDDAVNIMKYFSPQMLAFQKKVFLDKCRIVCLAGPGFAALVALAISKITGKEGAVHNELFISITISVAILTIALTCFIGYLIYRRQTQKHNLIMCGEYFRGMPDHEIIDEANKNYVDFINRMTAIEKANGAPSTP